MDTLVDKYMKEIEDNEASTYEKLLDLGGINLDVSFESKIFLVDICSADINYIDLTITPKDIQEINVEICDIWCKVDDKFLTKHPESSLPFMKEINKSLETYLNKKGIY